MKKKKGYFTKDITRSFISTNHDFDIDIIILLRENLSYISGVSGSTRRKLGRAANAILEYIETFAFIGGNLVERTRCREYLEWICIQQKGKIYLDTLNRKEYITVMIPSNKLGYIFGKKGSNFRRIEDETDTFIFFDWGR